jgi:hypothetical protein
MTVNANQRVENVVLVPASDKADAHTAVTKMRFYNEDGSPVVLATTEARLAALEARVNALDGAEVVEEVKTDDADGADGDVSHGDEEVDPEN